jgi:hypothetical protein
MPQVGFELMIPVFERAKTVHALDRVATVICGVNVLEPRILDLGTSWRRVISFTTRSLYSGESAHDTQWIGDWVRPSTDLDDGRGEKTWPYRDLNSDPSAV